MKSFSVKLFVFLTLAFTTGLVGNARADGTLTWYANRTDSGYPYLGAANHYQGTVTVRLGVQTHLPAGTYGAPISYYSLGEQGWVYSRSAGIYYTVDASGVVTHSDSYDVHEDWSNADWLNSFGNSPPQRYQARATMYDVDGQAHDQVITTFGMGGEVIIGPANWEPLMAILAAAAKTQKESFQIDPSQGCACDCQPGSDEGGLHSIDYKINLGRGAFGKNQGTLSFRSKTPSRLLAQPGSLVDAINDPACLTVYRNSTLRQVLAAQALVDVQPLTAYKYQIRFYHRLGGDPRDADGIYQLGGTLFKTITVENPDASPLLYNRLRITGSGDGLPTKTIEYDWSDADQSWDLVTGGGLRRERLATLTDPATGDQLQTRSVLNVSSQTVTKTWQRLHNYSWGDEMIAETLDPDGAALTSTWDYYEAGDATPGAFAGRLRQKMEASGRWERFEYDADGRETRHVSQFLDAPPGSPENQCRVVTTAYADSNPLQTTVESLRGVEIRRSYRAATSDHQEQEIVCQQPGAAWDAPGNLVTTRRYNAAGDVLRERRPDGTLTVSTFTVAGEQKTVTTATGAPNPDGTAVVDGTLTTSVTDRTGNPLLQTVADVASGLTLSSATTAQTDAFGRSTRTVSADGSAELTGYGCCGVESRTDRDGHTTTYTYDTLARLASETRAGITLLYTYDADGRRLTTVRQGSDGSRITVERLAYDLAGRQIRRTDALGYVTTFGETREAATGHTVRTTTLPDAEHSTRVETSFQDGSLLSVGGSAAHPLLYAYGADAAAGAWRQEIRVGEGGACSEWTLTYTDLAGRDDKMLTAAGAVSQSFFNAQGQRVRSVDPDGVSTLFAYNARGEQDTVAVDLDQNGQIDLAGTDRLTRTTRTVLQAHGTTVARTTTSAWTTAGADAPAVLGVEDQSVDGRSSWQVDASGLTTSRVTVCDGAGTCTTTLTAPDGSRTVSVASQGRTVSQTRLDADGQILGGTTLDYDAQGRPWHQSDRRDGATEFAYDEADQLRRVSHQGQSTSYAFDEVGRQRLQTGPDGGQVRTEYWPTGETRRVGGAGTYPQGYTFDAQGRLRTLTTQGAAGAAVTVWHYDAQSGQLVAKAYADGKGPSYAYTPAGRLATRTWARGSVTSYGYDPAGQLASIAYSDGTTPPAAYTFDRLGRLATASGGGSTRMLAYQGHTGLVTSEGYTAGPLAGIAVRTGYDGLRRRAGLEVTQGQTSLVAQSFGFDAASRLARASQGTASAEYSYQPDSAANLVRTLTFKHDGQPVMTTTKEYDLLDRLTRTASVRTGETTPVSGFAYAYNLANQRTRADVLADGTHWLYGYDALGQVTSGSRRWSSDGRAVAGQQYGYAYDGIGNRTSTTTNGRPSRYVPNALNQYEERTVPGAVDVTGTAAPDATVTLNGQAVTRQNGGYFAGTVAADNTQDAVDVPVDVVAARPDGGSNPAAEQQGRVFLPQTPEHFSYDLDGNLVQDGHWIYTWDGENRLVGLETLSSLPAAERTKLAFGYDDIGRRVQKQMWVWNVAGNSYQANVNALFVYNAWNLEVELNGLNGVALLRSYLWGSDMSGLFEEAGGVLGLLLITDHTQKPNNVNYVRYDGSGNVIGLTSASDGRTSAEYDYDAFGKVLKLDGPYARTNPIQFSTKYTDSESGFLYFGIRYLNSTNAKWTSRDPMEEKGGADVYDFVENNPINVCDYLGYTPLGKASDYDTASKNIHGQFAQILLKHYVYMGGTPLKLGHAAVIGLLRPVASLTQSLQFNSDLKSGTTIKDTTYTWVTFDYSNGAGGLGKYSITATVTVCKTLSGWDAQGTATIHDYWDFDWTFSKLVPALIDNAKSGRNLLSGREPRTAAGSLISGDPFSVDSVPLSIEEHTGAGLIWK